jgi:hypothetical protein
MKSIHKIIIRSRRKIGSASRIPHHHDPVQRARIIKRSTVHARSEKIAVPNPNNYICPREKHIFTYDKVAFWRSVPMYRWLVKVQQRNHETQKDDNF